MDLNSTDPEIIRKEVIPKLISMGEQGRRNGTINEMQFRDLMTQVIIIISDHRMIFTINALGDGVEGD